MFRISEESKAKHVKHRLRGEESPAGAAGGYDTATDSALDVDDGDENEEDEDEDEREDEADDNQENDARDNPLQGTNSADADADDDADGERQEQQQQQQEEDDDEKQKEAAPVEQMKDLQVSSEAEEPAETNPQDEDEGSESEAAEEDSPPQGSAQTTAAASKQAVPAKTAPAKRGKKGKAKKMAAKYKYQDEDDRAAAEALIGAAAGHEGELMVTNLSSFPSALTVIPVPDGDIRTHRKLFIVNEDLKRLGCSGRSGMSLTDPTPATQAKFYQLFRTSDRPPFFESVLELVKLCQTALFLFGKLEFEYVDGLLCDKTETAIGNWWTEVGAEYYNIEPTDGILGPTTVAALLGMLTGARNRLHYLGAPVAKDVFDIDCTKRGISWFQRSQKLEKTRRLDRQTVLKLHSVTAKAAAGEGWGVQKAVKSTVAEIGGKRGELVIGLVGGRDKGAIGDIETLDISKFVDLVSGERAKWLWLGKPKRTALESNEKTPDMSAILFGEKEAKEGAVTPSRRVQSLPLEEEVQHELVLAIPPLKHTYTETVVVATGQDEADLRTVVVELNHV
ncbi:Protein STB6 like protein [Verticillium longisporum]|nr:Protein STB6 like protein [Verticillium longisporum]